jgi:hypothetical protein
MSQDMSQINVNEKPTLERKKTPLKQMNANKTTLPRDDQLGQEPTAFDSSNPLTDNKDGRTIQITEVEYHFPKAGQEKSGEMSDNPVTDLSSKPLTEPSAEYREDQNKPSALEGAKDAVIQGAEVAKDKVQQGVQLAKEKLAPTTTTTTTTTPDSELTESKPGVFQRVTQGVKGVLSQGVEKAKGVFTAPARWTEPTELHPGNGYDWKRVEGEQGEIHWVATNDWSGDSASSGGLLAGAKGMVLSGVEKAKGVFSRPDTKESEVTDYNQPITQDQSKPGVLQGAKEKVWQGVEKAKSVFSSSAPTEEEHPAAWNKTTGDQDLVADNDWSGDSATQQQKPGVLQGAKDKVMQGVEKAKGMLTSSKPSEATTTTDVPLAQEQVPSNVGWKRVEIEREQTPSGYGREKIAIEKSADPRYKDPTMLKDQTGTDIIS